MKILISSNGYEIQVSDEDFEFLSHWSWFVHERFGNPHNVLRTGRGKYFGLGHEVLKRRGIKFKGQIDHKDRNILNGQFENLSPATASQNQANQGIDSRNSTGYKGVSWDKINNKYRAIIQIQGCVIRLGRFTDPVEAAKAYDKEAKRLFGAFAFLNFPEQ